MNFPRFIQLEKIIVTMKKGGLFGMNNRNYLIILNKIQTNKQQMGILRAQKNLGILNLIHFKSGNRQHNEFLKLNYNLLSSSVKSLFMVVTALQNINLPREKVCIVQGDKDKENSKKFSFHSRRKVQISKVSNQVPK